MKSEIKAFLDIMKEDVMAKEKEKLNAAIRTSLTEKIRMMVSNGIISSTDGDEFLKVNGIKESCNVVTRSITGC